MTRAQNATGRGQKAGRYRIDGHVLQLLYDNGNRVQTSIGLVKGKRRYNLLVGSGHFK